MSSIIIQYNEIVEMWNKTHSMEKIIDYINSLPTTTSKELIRYIRIQFSFLETLKAHFEQED